MRNTVETRARKAAGKMAPLGTPLHEFEYALALERIAILDWQDQRRRECFGDESAENRWAREREQARERCRKPEFKRNQQAYHAGLRAEMCALYGNACQRCGDTRLELLEQHHTASKHKDGYPTYPPEFRYTATPLVRATLKWVEDHGSLPADIELLCPTCHRAADKELSAGLSVTVP